jgi:hypothetical protein
MLSVCMCIPPLIARQRLGKNVTSSTNTHATVEQLLDASFSILSVSYQREVGDFLFIYIYVNPIYLFDSKPEAYDTNFVFL